jgi:molybdopterin-guanine dinucleotide biosynthesis protein A
MNKKLDLVILAGGKGKRLGVITKKTPKPLLKINGIPFLRRKTNCFSHCSFINAIYFYKANYNFFCNKN